LIDKTLSFNLKDVSFWHTLFGTRWYVKYIINNDFLAARFSKVCFKYYDGISGALRALSPVLKLNLPTQVIYFINAIVYY